MTRDRENPGRARAPCRDRSRDASLLFFGGGTTVARVSRGAGSTRARRARAGSPENPPDSRDRAPRVVRGGRYAARGVVSLSATIATLTLRGRSFLVTFSPSAAGASRRATRLRPPKRGSRVAAGSRASAARSHAAPLIATPSLTDPMAARLSHDRAANSSDRAEVRASRVESRSETTSRVRRVWGFDRRTKRKSRPNRPSQMVIADGSAARRVALQDKLVRIRGEMSATQRARPPRIPRRRKETTRPVAIS